MMNERALQIRRLSKGIQEKRITDADIVAAALDARLAKRKSISDSSQNVMSPAKKQQKSFHFNRDVCDPTAKENLENLPSYQASPYRALQGFIEVEHKKKTRQTIRDSKTQTQTIPYSNITSSPVLASSTQSLPVQISTEFPQTESFTDQSEVCPVTEPDSALKTTNNTPSSGPSTSCSLTAVQLRKVMLDYILQTLNSGNYDEITCLKGIGKVRAMKIFTKRNAGYVFDCMDDLEQIGMNSKNIETFVIQNIGYVLGKI